MCTTTACLDTRGKSFMLIPSARYMNAETVTRIPVWFPGHSLTFVIQLSVVTVLCVHEEFNFVAGDTAVSFQSQSLRSLRQQDHLSPKFKAILGNKGKCQPPCQKQSKKTSIFLHNPAHACLHHVQCRVTVKQLKSLSWEFPLSGWIH